MRKEKMIELFEQENDGILWKCKHIVLHQVPLKKADRDYLGSMYNIMVACETGETSVPLHELAAADLVTAAMHLQFTTTALCKR